MNKIVVAILSVFFMLIQYESIKACTVAIVSGKATPDGRPLLWKHRDTDTFDNKIAYLGQGKYKAMALVNSNDVDYERIWIGFNETGFAIMNSASYNLRGSDDTCKDHNEGYFMKAALLECATVEDFEQFLISHPKPLCVESNFGVIDAAGGAAFFETGNDSWTKIDVNDSSVAPHGYIVRSNYSFTGEPNKGAGYIRFEIAEKLFYRAAASNNLTVSHLVGNVCIAAKNPLSRQDVRHGVNFSENEDHFFYFQDCTNRYTSTSSIIVQGVLASESPLLTTMWSMVGFPLSSVVIPVWISPSGSLPAMVSAPTGQNAPICDKSLQLKQVMIPSTRGSTKYYINATKVFNRDKTGITQRLLTVNQEIIKKTNEEIEGWRKKFPSQKEVDGFYRLIDSYVNEKYESLFGL
jgi:hypothetical protein